VATIRAAWSVGRHRRRAHGSRAECLHQGLRPLLELAGRPLFEDMKDRHPEYARWEH